MKNYYIFLHSAFFFMTYAMKEDASINGQLDGYGKTPLHAAAEQDDYEQAKYLIKNGAPVNQADMFGNTPYLCARTNEMRNLLAKNGAQQNKKNIFGLTASNLYSIDLFFKQPNKKFGRKQNNTKSN